MTILQQVSKEIHRHPLEVLAYAVGANIASLSKVYGDLVETNVDDKVEFYAQVLAWEHNQDPTAVKITELSAAARGAAVSDREGEIYKYWANELSTNISFINTCWEFNNLLLTVNTDGTKLHKKTHAFA
ncbi:MAG: hypothetical protein RSC43_00110 [Clostridia bacterium]